MGGGGLLLGVIVMNELKLMVFRFAWGCVGSEELGCGCISNAMYTQWNE